MNAPDSPYIAIPKLLVRYCIALDDGDIASLRELMRDATLRNPDSQVKYHGSSGVEDMLRAFTIFYDENENPVDICEKNASPRTFHAVSNIMIEPSKDGQSAEAHSSFLVSQSLSDFPLQAIVQGRYHDRFVLDANEWRFAERIFFTRMFGNLSRHTKIDISSS